MKNYEKNEISGKIAKKYPKFKKKLKIRVKCVCNGKIAKSHEKLEIIQVSGSLRS